MDRSKRFPCRIAHSVNSRCRAWLEIRLVAIPLMGPHPPRGLLLTSGPQTLDLASDAWRLLLGLIFSALCLLLFGVWPFSRYKGRKTLRTAAFFVCIGLAYEFKEMQTQYYEYTSQNEMFRESEVPSKGRDLSIVMAYYHDCGGEKRFGSLVRITKRPWWNPWLLVDNIFNPRWAIPLRR